MESSASFRCLQALPDVQKGEDEEGGRTLPPVLSCSIIPLLAMELTLLPRSGLSLTSLCATTCSLLSPERSANFSWAGSIFCSIWKVSDRSSTPKERWGWSKQWFLQLESIGVWGSWHFWVCTVKHPLKSGIYIHRKELNTKICLWPQLQFWGKILLAWHGIESVARLCACLPNFHRCWRETRSRSS